MGSPSYEVVPNAHVNEGSTTTDIQPAGTFAELLGRTLSEVKVSDDKQEVLFTTTDGAQYSLNHYQDCCESVTVEDVVGDLSDLIGTPLTLAEESTNSESNPEDMQAKYGGEYQESFTWTFYRLATVRGAVTIRFYGTSNGYYSESVGFTFLGGIGVAAQNG